MADTTPRPARHRPRPRAESRRDELLQIAMRVFAEKGIAGATVRDIAQEAGILSGSLYHHFASKEEMVKEIVGEGPSGDANGYHALITAAAGPVEALHDCIVHAVGWAAENPHRARIFRNDAQYIEETPALAASEEKRRSNRLIWLAVVEQGIADGVFRNDVDAELTVRAMDDGILGSIRWFPPLGDADPAYVSEQLAAFYLAGLQRAGAPARRKRAARTA